MPTTIDGGTGASQIQNGTVTEAKIAAGAVTETKIADGAVTAAKLAVGAISTTSVLAATAGAEAGAVGTYAYLLDARAPTVSNAVGATLAGSSLRYVGIRTRSNVTADTATGSVTVGGTPSGTWRIMGTSENPNISGFLWYGISMWLRIS